MYPKIKLKFYTNDTTILTYVAQYNGANVSNAPNMFNIDNSSKRKAGFQLSGDSGLPYNILDARSEFFDEKGYPGFISSIHSSSARAVTFRVSGTMPNYLYIVFDLATGEHATSFQLKNVRNDQTVNVYNNELAVVRVDVVSLLLQNNDQVDLTINYWSAAGASHKVTAITPNLTIELIGSSLVNFKCSENLMNSELSIEPGICEQYANISLYDRNKFIRQMAKEDQLTDDITVEVCAVDDDNNELVIGSYISSEWNVDSNNSVIDLVCRDKSYLFEKINIARADVATRTLDDLLNILFNQAPGMSWIYLDSATEELCKHIQLPDSWYLASNLYEMLDKICAIGMLRIYWYIDTFIVGRCL